MGKDFCLGLGCKEKNTQKNLPQKRKRTQPNRSWSTLVSSLVCFSALNDWQMVLLIMPPVPETTRSVNWDLFCFLQMSFFSFAYCSPRVRFLSLVLFVRIQNSKWWHQRAFQLHFFVCFVWMRVCNFRVASVLCKMCSCLLVYFLHVGFFWGYRNGNLLTQCCFLNYNPGIL